MNPNKETLDTWNNVAHMYQEKFMELDLYHSSYDHFCEALKNSRAQILDIGCGPGNITKYLLFKRPDFHILGIDTAPNMIELAKKNNPSARFAVLDCREINTLDQTFDGIISGFCLPYLSPMECNELIATAYRLLQTKGVLYLSFVEGPQEKSDFKTNSFGRVYFYYHSVIELKNQLLKNKFDEITTYHVKYWISETEWEWHTILIAIKGV